MKIPYVSSCEKSETLINTINQIIDKVNNEVESSDFIKKVKVNGVELPVEDSTVSIQQPTKNSELINDTEYINKEGVVKGIKVKNNIIVPKENIIELNGDIIPTTPPSNEGTEEVDILYNNTKIIPNNNELRFGVKYRGITIPLDSDNYWDLYDYIDVKNKENIPVSPYMAGVSHDTIPLCRVYKGGFKFIPGTEEIYVNGRRIFHIDECVEQDYKYLTVDGKDNLNYVSSNVPVGFYTYFPLDHDKIQPISEVIIYVDKSILHNAENLTLTPETGYKYVLQSPYSVVGDKIDNSYNTIMMSAKFNYQP